VDIRYSKHAAARMTSRHIREEWVLAVLNSPGFVENVHEDEVHYLRAIAGYGGRVLRVVVNPQRKPLFVVTLYFDRGMKGKLDEADD
jgi:hypothetical protein